MPTAARALESKFSSSFEGRYQSERPPPLKSVAGFHAPEMQAGLEFCMFVVFV
jgi:hypothetical protein